MWLANHNRLPGKIGCPAKRAYATAKGFVQKRLCAPYDLVPTRTAHAGNDDQKIIRMTGKL
jgi:hypothetical protein